MTWDPSLEWRMPSPSDEVGREGLRPRHLRTRTFTAAATIIAARLEADMSLARLVFPPDEPDVEFFFPPDGRDRNA